jgi:hypothetical protein
MNAGQTSTINRCIATKKKRVEVTVIGIKNPVRRQDVAVGIGYFKQVLKKVLLPDTTKKKLAAF